MRDGAEGIESGESQSLHHCTAIIGVMGVLLFWSFCLNAEHSSTFYHCIDVHVSRDDIVVMFHDPGAYALQQTSCAKS
jgi:hypothetical protein